jgi:putative membrane protein
LGEVKVKGLKLFIKDWHHIAKHKQARIAVIILLLIPLLYAGMFLLGYWDPYGNLEKLPVAVVNLDKGAVMNGKTLHVGHDLTANLSKDKALDFHFVTSDNADNGLKNGQYDMIVKIPEDFSQKVTTLMDEKPQAADLVYKTNPGNNFIAGQIGASAISKLKDEVGNEITKSYTETVFTQFQQLSNGMAAAGSGASDLNNGTKKAQDGLHSVQEGINRLANGAANLSNGVKPLAEGQVMLSQSLLHLKAATTALYTGVNQLTDAHKQLEQGASNLAQGAGQVREGATTGEKTGVKVLADAQGLSEQLLKYVQSHPDLEKDADLQMILQQAGGLSNEAKAVHDGQDQLAKSIIALQAGQSGLAADMNQYGEKLSHAREGSGQISAGLNRVTEGIDKWQKGFQALSRGVTSLADGGRQLQTGTVPLANGMLQLVDGSGELSKSLTAAAQKTSGIHTSDSMLSMFSRPVQLVENQINAVPNYGTAMTPYFLTLGLFVGGLIASNIIPFNRKANPEVAGRTHFINKICLFLSIAFIQTAIVDLVILYGFQVQMLSIPKFILLSIAASFTYTTCIFMLVTLLGGLGRLAAIFLLVTQLASSGGTFPLQLASSFIQFISKCLPMTYAVEGFRSVISTGDWTQYWHNTAALIGYMAVFVSISLFVILASNEKGSAMQPVRESHVS